LGVAGAQAAPRSIGDIPFGVPLHPQPRDRLEEVMDEQKSVATPLADAELTAPSGWISTKGRSKERALRDPPVFRAYQEGCRQLLSSFFPDFGKKSKDLATPRHYKNIIS
jgi:hypothetical protein